MRQVTFNGIPLFVTYRDGKVLDVPEPLYEEEKEEEVNIVMTPRILLRRLFVCWWGGCPETLHVMSGKTLCYWRCKICNRIIPD